MAKHATWKLSAIKTRHTNENRVGQRVPLQQKDILSWVKTVLSNKEWDGSLAIEQKWLVPKTLRKSLGVVLLGAGEEREQDFEM